jgi:hypothetical protein
VLWAVVVAVVDVMVVVMLAWLPWREAGCLASVTAAMSSPPSQAVPAAEDWADDDASSQHRTCQSPDAAVSARSITPATSRSSLASGPSTAIMGPRGQSDASGGLMRSSTRSLLMYGMLMTMASTLRACAWAWAAASR